jgi:hypothetical protein
MTVNAQEQSYGCCAFGAYGGADQKDFCSVDEAIVFECTDADVTNIRSLSATMKAVGLRRRLCSYVATM